MKALESMCDEVLIGTLPKSLKDQINANLRFGITARDIKEHALHIAGGKRTLTVLAIEAYLRLPQNG
jgi:hypothetical protein